MTVTPRNHTTATTPGSSSHFPAPIPVKPPVRRMPWLEEEVPIALDGEIALLDYAEYPRHDWQADERMAGAHDLHLLRLDDDDFSGLFLLCNNCPPLSSGDSEARLLISRKGHIGTNPRHDSELADFILTAIDHVFNGRVGHRSSTQMNLFAEAWAIYSATDDLCEGLGHVASTVGNMVFRYFRLADTDLADFPDAEDLDSISPDPGLVLIPGGRTT